jgi:hypothetical protein
MQYPALVRAAALALPAVLFSTGAAWAQTTEPQPNTMVDTAPLPAQDRESNGAVIMMDQPVLAQSEAMAQAQARMPDTTALGAGPARLSISPARRVYTRQEVERMRREAERIDLPK